MKNCPNCNKEITKRRNKFCDYKCSLEYRNTKFKENNPDKACLYCKKAIPYSKKFCNNSCSNSYNNSLRILSDSTKKKQRMASIKNKSYKNFNGILSEQNKSCLVFFNNCKVCNTLFTVSARKKEQKCCSKECFKIQDGGLRHGSSRGKSGWYKGYWCDSTYELAYVIYNIDNNVDFKRSKIVIPYSYKNKNYNYHPDFENSSTLIEVKGYHTEQVDTKIKATKEAGYNLQMLYKDDLKYAFDYVKTNYDYKNIEDLYEKR